MKDSQSSLLVLRSRVAVVLLLQLLLLCCTATCTTAAPVSVVAPVAAAILRQRNHKAVVKGSGKTTASSSSSSSSSSSTTTSTKVSSAAWLDGIKNGLASAMAAACVKTTLQPIDAIKTIQQYHIAKTAGAGGGGAAAAAESAAALSILAACREIMSGPGGFWNFYAGLGVTVFGAMPGVALYFGVYSYCKKHLLQTARGRRHKTASIALSAAIGNSVASFSRVPYEVIKQKLQTKAYSSTWEAFRAIATSGQWWSIIFPRGGVAIQMIRDVPYAICTLMLYEYFRSLSASQRHSNNNNGGGGGVVNDKAWDFALGGIAGGTGSWVTTPMDVVKTRLQTDPELYDGSVWKCTKALWLEGGAPAFLRGAVPRLMHKVPANAFFFLFYETFRKLLRVDDLPV